ncbi:hypothetical protein FOMPIDRAFT_1048852 [Fomitopsis schrenkii]|uniref:Cytochrome P450 n=1 Tax=Fomitopsis schrenkii TaxID=2126942 RepID=S8EDW3_FOMSC|nr:hypothetical protein FOMPIDRAFT_1048852 [Fomitopsis schrenkii]
MDTRLVSSFFPVACVFGYLLWRIIQLLLRPYTSSLRHLRGPQSPGWLLGHVKQVYGCSEEWTETYGETFKFKGFCGSDTLFTADTRALHHVLNDATTYVIPDVQRRIISEIVGNGLPVTEGEQHRRQRRVMNPAFGPAQIRDLTGIFLQKSTELCQFWGAQFTDPGESARIDLLDGLSKMTLDVIGLAGFDYDFGCLNASSKPNELNAALHTLFLGGNNVPPLFRWLRLMYPILKRINAYKGRELREAKKVMHDIGMGVVQEKKRAVAKLGIAGVSPRRDLLTLLTRANMDPSVPENQRLSDEEILAQVPTFLLAGHETTSNATAWALYALSTDLAIQTKLREECFSLSTSDPTMDELNSLPFLESVVRESLRLHPPVESAARTATRDDIIPLGKPCIDARGRAQDHLRVEKGVSIHIPILAVNRSKAIWGEDALKFRPDRWNDVPETAQKVPGSWANTMTFLGGTRSCIGFRFTIIEIKALLFTLMRTFEFELAVPMDDVQRQTTTLLQRPVLRSAADKGSQLPMLVKYVQRT